MSDEPRSSDGPRRTSTEPTLAIPRDRLPPISVEDVTSMGLDPEHDETRALLERAYVRGDRETLDACPVCSALCRCCGGIGMTSPVRAAAFAAALEAAAANDIEPPPEAA